MNRPLPFLAFLTLTIISVDAIAETPSQAPIQSRTPDSVRVQPRGPDFAPNSTQDSTVQGRLTIFNADQDALNAAMDRKLRICRGC
jgi:hypothetical protein